jgi:hypothetical protein
VFPGYLMAQVVGSVLACLLLWALVGKVGLLGATEPGRGVSDLQAMVMEAALTFGLVTVILGTASGAQNVGPLSALAVGGYVALAGLWSSPISGASMNPGRSFGPDLVMGDFSHFWVYLVGPLLGALLAVGAAHVLRGRGGGAISELSDAELAEFFHDLAPVVQPRMANAPAPGRRRRIVAGVLMPTTPAEKGRGARRREGAVAGGRGRSPSSRRP